jgi:hypothetical protein
MKFYQGLHHRIVELDRLIRAGERRGFGIFTTPSGVVLPETHLNCVYQCLPVVSFSFSREREIFENLPREESARAETCGGI